MKKLIISVIVGCLVVTTLTACGSNTSKKSNKENTDSKVLTSVSPTTEETSSANETEETTDQIVNDEWKAAFSDYIKNDSSSDDSNQYALIYIDNDDLPELAIWGNCEAKGCKICNYNDGRINETQLCRLDFSYIEKKNLLCNESGNMGSYFDYVYSIKDGKMAKIAEGEYTEELSDNLTNDTNSEPVYHYQWNSKSVTKEEYTKSFTTVYDTSQAKTISEDEKHSKTDILKILNTDINN